MRRYASLPVATKQLLTWPTLSGGSKKTEPQSLIFFKNTTEDLFCVKIPHQNALKTKFFIRRFISLQKIFKPLCYRTKEKRYG